MKAIAYVCLHYGKEYLAWAIRSIQDAVQEIHILYSDRPSFGYDTTMVCPDSEEELKQEANRFLTKPIFWHKDRWTFEGAHRRFALDIAIEHAADRLLVLDADEIWPPGLAKEAVEASFSRYERDVVLSMVHFYRSMNRVCRDALLPVRVLNPKGAGRWKLDPQRHPILHFGYAQSEAVTRYKTEIHGHKKEWRPEWLEDKFSAWTPEGDITDVHPVNRNFWDPKPVTEMESALVEATLRDHPNFGKTFIR